MLIRMIYYMKQQLRLMKHKLKSSTSIKTKVKMDFVLKRKYFSPAYRVG